MGITNPVHLAFIAIIALIVLGPKRLPELARSLGHGMREFRESLGAAVERDEPDLTIAPGATTQPAVVHSTADEQSVAPIVPAPSPSPAVTSTPSAPPSAASPAPAASAAEASHIAEQAHDPLLGHPS